MVDSISDTDLINTMKKQTQALTEKEWSVPKTGAEFLAKMEDLLYVSEFPYAHSVWWYA